MKIIGYYIKLIKSIIKIVDYNLNNFYLLIIIEKSKNSFQNDFLIYNIFFV